MQTLIEVTGVMDTLAADIFEHRPWSLELLQCQLSVVRC